MVKKLSDPGWTNRRSNCPCSSPLNSVITVYNLECALGIQMCVFLQVSMLELSLKWKGFLSFTGVPELSGDTQLSNWPMSCTEPPTFFIIKNSAIGLHKHRYEDIIIHAINPMKQNPSWEADSCFYSCQLVDCEVWFPCSQQPTTGPYFEPGESSPQNYSFSLRCFLILFFHLRPRIPKWPVPFRFSDQRFSCVSHFPCVLHDPPISSSLILPHECYLMNNAYKV